ncbi:putative Ran-interacting Mog1 protein [Blattamonas nauphoetae]|uniref:Ran-interacting Mog1 protein n=1 Tax=Blattamonas nauphoetae TaxID=2049346 RepID=A0ABQ9XXQ9_9EUKA|nr:putative Ran-interacting Mog1 protein [Blattamonas nauphoetae]
MEFAHRDLFGGAIEVDLPKTWVDASTGRPVQDNQEIYLHPTNQLNHIIIEIMERAPIDDSSAIAFHYKDLSELNQSLDVVVHYNCTLTNQEVPCVSPTFPKFCLVVNHVLGRFHNHDVISYIGLIRIKEVETDILINVNITLPGEITPKQQPPTRPENPTIDDFLINLGDYEISRPAGTASFLSGRSDSSFEETEHNRMIEEQIVQSEYTEIFKSRIGESSVHPSDGDAYLETTFRLVVFKPFPNEIMIGTVIGSITLGFFKHILIPPWFLPSGVSYDTEAQCFVINDRVTRKVSRLVPKSVIRFKVVETKFYVMNKPPAVKKTPAEAVQPGKAPPPTVIASGQTEKKPEEDKPAPSPVTAEGEPKLDDPGDADLIRQPESISDGTFQMVVWGRLNEDGLGLYPPEADQYFDGE